MESELAALKTELEAARTERDRLAQLHTQALARIAELDRQAEKNCGWAVDEDGVFDTYCGQRFEFEAGGIKENEFDYCPFCRGQIIELRTA